MGQISNPAALRITVVMMFSVLFVYATPFVALANSVQPTHVIFLPQVTNHPNVASDSTAPSVCALNEKESAMADLLQTAPEQQRQNLRCDPILAAVARARAEDMAYRNYFGHTNLDGKGPNALILEAGYPLPDEYSTGRSANNIESIGAGTESAEVMWQGWLQSGHHSTHILGQNEFYREQTDFGIGFASVPGSEFTHYWVVITVKPATRNMP